MKQTLVGLTIDSFDILLITPANKHASYKSIDFGNRFFQLRDYKNPQFLI